MGVELILSSLLLFGCLCGSYCIPVNDVDSHILEKIKSNAKAPAISPSIDPEPPFLPVLAPSPLTPFINRSLPISSGLCKLNFSAAANMISTTAADCWNSFAPYLANAVCCPQFDATLVILLGQYSKYSGMLNLDRSNAMHCLSDFEKILESRGANNNLRKLCSIHPSNLTEASCPVADVNMFESTVDSLRLLAACGKIDPVNECCTQVCQNAILDAARKLAMNGTSNFTESSTRIDDCKNIVLRWLASKLDPSSANAVLRGLSNCKVNKGCPLAFPNTINITQKCAYMISDQTACCKAMENYVSHLQQQTFVTNLQALSCAASLGVKLQKANVSDNVYHLCDVNLKDFSLQVGSKDSGCLLPSLPSDVTFDEASGIGFICDLNDNIEAPWPSDSTVLGSCNETAKIPALPTAASGESGLYPKKITFPLLLSFSLVLSTLI